MKWDKDKKWIGDLMSLVGIIRLEEDIQKRF